MNYETTIRSEAAEAYRPDISQFDDAPAASRKKWIAIGIAILFAGALAMYFLVAGGENGAVGAGDDASQRPAITVIAPGQTTIAGMITATGTLAARREMPVGVVGEGGRVVSVPVEAGQWVSQGQVLAVIDRSVQVQQAQSSSAQIEVARSDARLAQANLDRALQLVERGFISKADVDRLTATRDAAAARVKVAEAQYRELLARNARLNIVAPAAGLLLTRAVEPGQTVGAGTPALFTIARGGEMELLAEVGEVELAQLSTGVAATIRPVGTDKDFTGQVWQLAPVIDAQRRQGTARIALPYAPELRPGGFATATISSGTVVAPVLPESAILSDDEGSFVYIVGKENKVERRRVETGLVSANGIAVVKGLAGTEKVVLRAGGFLSPGETIRPVLAKAGS
ncbi:efflux RND transporter periplasmic adaptor subunit [Altererythrobacter sp. H2]|uniref:efflux RND transporter periplasmic adaptor subunit n=1 Tax=Altererythrobacter sp. H2 TaxID=3108391 RepID=UPI002B4BE0D8|nr:efflux RND transporter periplasmic adaptor subunit [Altererythrobacter sp. H2]WRK95982.1 efflux RND transporter periplasmic adaptor subunit [Altererythrobacter sp. H2]